MTPNDYAKAGAKGTPNPNPRKRCRKDAKAAGDACVKRTAEIKMGLRRKIGSALEEVTAILMTRQRNIREAVQVAREITGENQ